MGKKKAKGMTRRAFLKSAGATAAALTVSGVPTLLRSQGKDIDIAVVDAITGRAAKWGVAWMGEELAVEEINQAGGIKSMGGAKLVLSKYDTESKVETGVTAAQRAVQKGAKAIFGCAGSSICLMVTQIAEREKVPMLLAQASDIKIMQRGFKYTFRVCANSEVLIPAALNIASRLEDKKTGRKVKTLAHLYEDSAYGQAETAVIKRDASKYGLEFVSGQAFPGGTPDLTPYVNKLKSINPDFIVGSVFFFDICNFIRTFREQNFSPMGYHFGAEADEFLTEMKKDANYTFTHLPWDEKMKLARIMEVVQRFTQKFKQNMDAFAMHGYVCAYVLKDAFERAASTDSDKLLKALKETDLTPDKGNFLPTKDGRIQFDEIGENKNIIMMEGQILNQRREIILPPQYKTLDPIFPIPKWSERG